jgi:hypothetical protein
VARCVSDRVTRLSTCHVDVYTRSHCGDSSMRNLVFAAWAELRKASTGRSESLPIVQVQVLITISITIVIRQYSTSFKATELSTATVLQVGSTESYIYHFSQTRTS